MINCSLSIFMNSINNFCTMSHVKSAIMGTMFRR